MEECCTQPENDILLTSQSTVVSKSTDIPIKKEPVVVDLATLDDADRKRHRRKLRMDYIRNKRSRIAEGHVPAKRQRLEPVFTNFNFSPIIDPSPPVTDLNKLRQLKNRESAERSRQKKDNLIDSLTCQVCECYVQLSDLLAENKWLLEVQHAVDNGLPIPQKDVSDSSSCYTTSSSDCSSSCSVSSVSVTSSGASSPMSAPCMDACTSSGCSSPTSSSGYNSHSQQQACIVSSSPVSSISSTTSAEDCYSLSSCSTSSGDDHGMLFASLECAGWDEFDSVIEDFDMWFQEASSTVGVCEAALPCY